MHVYVGYGADLHTCIHFVFLSFLPFLPSSPVREGHTRSARVHTHTHTHVCRKLDRHRQRQTKTETCFVGVCT
jgi:hypothetical protein